MSFAGVDMITSPAHSAAVLVPLHGCSGYNLFSGLTAILQHDCLVVGVLMVHIRLLHVSAPVSSMQLTLTMYATIIAMKP